MTRTELTELLAKALRRSCADLTAESCSELGASEPPEASLWPAQTESPAMTSSQLRPGTPSSRCEDVRGVEDLKTASVFSGPLQWSRTLAKRLGAKACRGHVQVVPHVCSACPLTERPAAAWGPAGGSPGKKGCKEESITETLSPFRGMGRCVKKRDFVPSLSKTAPQGPCKASMLTNPSAFPPWRGMNSRTRRFPARRMRRPSA